MANRYLDNQRTAGGNAILDTQVASDSSATGTANITEDSDSVSSTATILVSASSSLSESDDTISATGLLSIAGTGSVTEEPDTVTATGTAASSGTVTGSANILEAEDSITASAVTGSNPLLIPTTSTSSGAFVTPVTRYLVSTGNTINYVRHTRQNMWLYNTHTSSVTINILGSSSTSVFVNGVAGLMFSLAGGLSVTIPAGAFKIIQLDAAHEYLSGAVNITSTVAGVVVAALVSSS